MLLDSLSPEIVLALAQGQQFQSATLLVNATGQQGPPTHQYEFEEVLLVSDSHGGSGKQQMTENVAIHFDSFEFSNVN